MNRRNFLKLSVAAAVAAYTPLPAMSEPESDWERFVRLVHEGNPITDDSFTFYQPVDIDVNASISNCSFILKGNSTITASGDDLYFDRNTIILAKDGTGQTGLTIANGRATISNVNLYNKRPLEFSPKLIRFTHYAGCSQHKAPSA